jgi:hypothetical protein
LVFAKISSRTPGFKQAEDFPRDALIYVQIQDLPALIKLWNDSEIRRKYLDSQNFYAFQNNHLALKLAERAVEINEAVGISPDLGFASGLSENKAALAVYDIGRMEFVFIAPLGEEKILASALFQMQSDFEEIRLDDETTVFSKEIEIDRARQKQKIFFANFRGRLILATSEKYFLQTIDNVKGKTPKNRLSAEPLFSEIAGKTKPKLATVWLNQQKLNDDWYFKHYWLMSETDSLKHIRSGMFDFEIQDKKLTERRVFLTAENKSFTKIDAGTANRIGSLIPENIPFYKIEEFETNGSEELLRDSLFDVNKYAETYKTAKSKKDFYFRDWEKSYSYSNLDEDFREQIDELDAEPRQPVESIENANNALAKVIGVANPGASVKLSAPENRPSPLFFENRKALIFSLRNPANLNRRQMESAFVETAQKLFTVNTQKSEFGWTDFEVDKFTARRMTMPSLGWEIFYFVRQNELVLANSEDLLKQILTASAAPPKFTESFEKFTVINLEHGRAAFDEIFETLEKTPDESGDVNGSGFFTGNIGSLLDVASDVERIEIRQTSAQNLLFEEIDFVLKEKPE